MSGYDGLLLIFGTMILLMTDTLGLIPSMIAKKTPAAWIPQSTWLSLCIKFQGIL